MPAAYAGAMTRGLASDDAGAAAVASLHLDAVLTKNPGASPFVTGDEQTVIGVHAATLQKAGLEGSQAIKKARSDVREVTPDGKRQRLEAYNLDRRALETFNRAFMSAKGDGPEGLPAFNALAEHFFGLTGNPESARGLAFVAFERDGDAPKNGTGSKSVGGEQAPPITEPGAGPVGTGNNPKEQSAPGSDTKPAGAAGSKESKPERILRFGQSEKPPNDKLGHTLKTFRELKDRVAKDPKLLERIGRAEEVWIGSNVFTGEVAQLILLSLTATPEERAAIRQIILKSNDIHGEQRARLLEFLKATEDSKRLDPSRESESAVRGEYGAFLAFLDLDQFTAKLEDRRGAGNFGGPVLGAIGGTARRAGRAGRRLGRLSPGNKLGGPIKPGSLADKIFRRTGRLGPATRARIEKSLTEARRLTNQLISGRLSRSGSGGRLKERGPSVGASGADSEGPNPTLRMPRTSELRLIKQLEKMDCAVACVGMVLADKGVGVGMRRLRRQLKTDVKEGTAVEDIPGVLKRHGVKSARVQTIDKEKIDIVEEINKATKDGNPAIVVIRYTIGSGPEAGKVVVHSVVVDGVRMIDGRKWVAIRDPKGDPHGGITWVDARKFGELTDGRVVFTNPQR